MIEIVIGIRLWIFYKSDGGTKSLARVKIRSTGFIETTTHFRKTQDEKSDHDRADNERDQTVGANQRKHFRRQTENARADNAVDSYRHQVPTANAANQSFCCRRRYF